MISVLFGFQEPQIQRIVTSVRTAFMTDFVPNNLGFHHITHEDFRKKHTTKTASTLFSSGPDDAIVVLDGTYIYIQKSSDYDFQRRSYSMHKNRSLLKPMVIVGTDGYILDIVRPYKQGCIHHKAFHDGEITQPSLGSKKMIYLLLIEDFVMQ